MAVKIQETFQVEASAARVWEYLVDPHQVVHCLPGAELVEVQEENTFLGRVRVKVGPVTATYRGKATFVERDDEARRVRMVGEGQETGGSGFARMTMDSQVTDLGGGRSEVRVDAELEVVGRIVQFGRGMIEEVSRQLFRQFAECTRSRLAQPTAAATAAPAGSEGEAAIGGGEVTSGAATSPPAPTARAQPAAPAAAAPVRALPLLFRAIGARLRRFLGRLVGRRGDG